MGKRREVVGHRFGSLVILSEAPPSYRSNGSPMRRVVAKCDCGQEKNMLLHNILHGISSSCGCKAGAHKHGHRPASGQSRTYNTWRAMLNRCHNPKHTAYNRYGAKGIAVCEQWRDSFATFLEDMGERPEGCTLDRKDGTKGYFKDNCQWSTPKEQHANSNLTRSPSGKFTKTN